MWVVVVLMMTEIIEKITLTRKLNFSHKFSGNVFIVSHKQVIFVINTHFFYYVETILLLSYKNGINLSIIKMSHDLQVI